MRVISDENMRANMLLCLLQSDLQQTALGTSRQGGGVVMWCPPDFAPESFGKRESTGPLEGPLFVPGFVITQRRPLPQIFVPSLWPEQEIYLLTGVNSNQWLVDIHY